MGAGGLHVAPCRCRTSWPLAEQLVKSPQQSQQTKNGQSWGGCRRDTWAGGARAVEVSSSPRETRGCWIQISPPQRLGLG